MPDIVWADVVAVAKPSDLVGVSADFKVLVLGYVNEVANPAAFGGDSSVTFKLARAYLAAHYATLSVLGAFPPVGPITSQSEGGVSASFATMMPTAHNPLQRTAYGDTFLTFVNRSAARAGFTT